MTAAEEHVQVIAATNRIDILDPALLRSGRLDRKIEFPLPNESARARILEIHSRKMMVSSDVNYDELARSTDEFNAAQLKAVCVEAGMIALREGATQLGHEHFLSGIAEGEKMGFVGCAQLTIHSTEQEKEQSDVFCVVDDIDSKLRGGCENAFLTVAHVHDQASARRDYCAHLCAGRSVGSGDAVSASAAP